VRWLAAPLLALAFALSTAALAADEAPLEGVVAPAAAPEAKPAGETPPVDSAPPVARRVVLRGIKFGSDTAYIEPASAGVLELVAEQLREHPTVRVRIDGYTDESASEQHNLELSHERAEAVKRILVGFGVGPERLDVVGYGEAKPIATNATPEGRALNRRVELDVIE
jgi:OOP family OmpA-OmpF porin